MSLNSQTSSNFIKSVFGPKVAVLCSQDAELVSKRNNLSFVQLLRPFCNVTNEIQVRDVHSQPSQITELCISLQDLKNGLPNETQMNQMIFNSVQSCIDDSSSLQTWNIKHENYDININSSCPWYEAYREAVTSLAPQRDNEFINYFVACFLVVSSSHPNPLEEFSRLSGQQNQIQHSTPDSTWKWMIPNTLKYFVLLHDNSQADISRAQGVMKDLQSMHNNACFLLQINSKSTDDGTQDMPDPWTKYLSGKETPSQNSQTAEKNPSNEVQGQKKVYGCCLTISDHENLRTFMYECASKGIIPHMEKNIRSLNEQIAQRKALHRTIVRATKSFFGKAPTAPSSSPGSRTAEPLEQIRKVADLCFLCQLYENAYQFYYTAKKDLSSEGAWISAASSSEMAALSKFMQQPRAQRSYPTQYVDSAIDTYLNRTSDDYVALRCVMLSLECLSQQKLYPDAATQLLRLTNDENDLKCALLLEQVAHCYLRAKRPMLRKFAFYLVLAGHRFGKASQRHCALHCYSSALQVYSNAGWRLALDHIYFTLGRHFLSLNNFTEAITSFEQLVVKSSQSSIQQLLFLNEYLEIANRYKETFKENISYRIPSIQYKRNTVRFEMTEPGYKFDSEFENLEDIARNRLYPNGLIIFKKKGFEAVENETVWVDICVVNNLDVTLSLKDVNLKFEYCATDSKMVIPAISNILVKVLSKQYLTFQFQPDMPGSIRIFGLSYKLSTRNPDASFNAPQSSLELEGVQLFSDEHTMELTVVPAMPKLLVSNLFLPSTMMFNEIASSPLTIANVGPKTARNLSFVSPSQACCVVADPQTEIKSINEQFLRLFADKQVKPGTVVMQKSLISSLAAGEEVHLRLWVQSSQLKQHKIEFVIYYEDGETFDEKGKRTDPRTRFLRYRHEAHVLEGVHFDPKVSWNSGGKSSALVIAHVSKDSSPSKLESFCCDSKQWLLQHLLTPPYVPQNFAFQARSSPDSRRIKNEREENYNIQWVNLQSGDKNFQPGGLDKLLNITFAQDHASSAPEDSASETKPFMIAVQWAKVDEQSNRVGQSYVPITELGSSSILPEILPMQDLSSNNLEALHRIVKWSIYCKSEVHHHFDIECPCIVPVDIIIFNQHNCTLRVTVDAMNSQNVAAGGDLLSSHSFTWVGKAFYDLELPPCGQHSIQMHAYFTQSGTFNINSFDVWATPVASNKQAQLIPQTRQPAFLLSVFNDADIF